MHNATSEDHDTAPTVVGDELHTGPSVPVALSEDGTFHHPRRKHIHLSEPVYEFDITVPTLLVNHTLDIHVARSKLKLPIPGPPHYFTKFTVNGKEIVPLDVPARNGALHVTNHLLNPHHCRHHCHHRDHEDRGDEEALDRSWDDWEEWLPQWAMED